MHPSSSTGKPPAPDPVVFAHGITVAFTDDELVALFHAAVFAGAYQRPGAGDGNIGITPEGIIRELGALDSARAKLAVALGSIGEEGSRGA